MSVGQQKKNDNLILPMNLSSKKSLCALKNEFNF